MPAIQVAKTDTLEQQRQKINQIGASIFNVTAGGSDLLAGNLKLGDGTRTAPSLSFSSDDKLGIYKPDTKTIGYVSDGKKIADFSPTAFLSFRNFIVRQNKLATSNISILNYGTNYDPGSYTNISLVGGTGEGATANIVVAKFTGTITNSGQNYTKGSFSGISLQGGSGTGAIVSFDVDGLSGTITNAGSGYIPGTYTNIPLTSISPVTGSGATATVLITGTTVTNGSITTAGSLYTNGTYSQIAVLNKPTTTYTVTTVSNNFYINGIQQQALTLVKGNTYRFDVSSATNVGHQLTFQNTDNSSLAQLDYVIINKGTPGSSGAFVDLVIKPTAVNATIKYTCTSHASAGANITVTTGTAGRYSSGVSANVTVSGGSITSFTISSNGIDLKSGDILNVASLDVGGTGSGFEYTVSGFTYNGTVTGVTISSDGINYVKNQTLSFNNSSVGGTGSGFVYTVSTDPGKIKNLVFTSKGSGYAVNNVLSLPGNVTGVAATLKGSKTGVTTTLSTSSKQITVSSTVGIVAGMTVLTGQVDAGQLPLGTTVSTIDSGTTLTLSSFPTSSGSATLSFTSTGSLNEITVASVANISSGSTVTVTSGTGVLAANTTVSSVNSQTNTITLSANPTTAGSVTLTFSPPFGVGTTPFSYTIGNLGEIETFTISSGGNGYSLGDTISVSPYDLAQPITYPVKAVTVQTLTFTGTVPSSAFIVGNTIELNSGTTQTPAEILQIKTSGSNITSILIRDGGYIASDVIKKTGGSTPYTINTVVNGWRFFIDTGSGYTLTPSLTFYVGNTYLFDLSDSSNSNHVFSLSKFRDGKWSPSLFTSISSTLSTSSAQITIASTTGISAGMEVVVTSGSGVLQPSTKVLSVDSATTLTLDKIPTTAGLVNLSIYGSEYTSNVTRSSTSLKIQVVSSTPNLYYYCASSGSLHVDEGGEDNSEALITINQTNPKIFGSNFSAQATTLTSTDVITGNISDGSFTSQSISSSTATFVNQSVTGTTNSTNIVSTNITAASIASTTALSISAGSSVNVSADLNIGTTIQILNSTGDITTSGTLKTTGTLNVNDKLTITNDTISSTSGNNVVISPATGRVAKINTTSAITIPSGTTAQRPTVGIVENGSIRFNTDSGQYEGYNAATTSWSSLGGVRDLDGNTYIAAEASVGANDNTLYFYNDGNNTIKVTPTELVFNTVKSIDSPNTSNPANTPWIANTAVALNAYLSYGLNLYKVTTAGTTAGSANPPTHTTGTVVNGTAQLLWYANYADDITFDQVQNVVIRSNLLFKDDTNNELRLTKNIISTGTSDLVLQPLAGKKVTINATSSLVLPSGDSNSRGVAAQGSVRYNTTITQFEGYNGTNWTSLGGVKDVDGNTYIIPETSPGANENILYFYNNGSNTLRLSTTELTFNTIDQIGSTNNNLDLQAQTVTFNSLSLTIDNSSTSSKFLSTKTNIDLALSVGLYTDPLIRLNTSGDIYINKTFGTGSNTLIKVLDNELKTFELDDVKIETAEYILTKGTTNSGASVIYDPTVYSGAKVVIVANNITADHREIFEFTVVSKGTDIFHTEYGNVTTGADVISAAFDFNAGGNVRLTSTLASAVANGNVVNVTVTSTLIKK